MSKFFIIFVISTFYVTEAAATECRTAALPDGTPAMFCKDKKGNWKQQEGKVEVASTATTNSSGQLLYADASYRGTGVYHVPIKTRKRQPRNLADVLIASTEPKTQKEEIFVSTTMRIEGAVITGQISGGNWNKVPLSGTRKNGVCDFSASLNNITVVYVGKCDERGFSGQMTTYGQPVGTVKGEFQMDTISFTDTSARDAKKVELQKSCDAGSQSACVELEQL
jgi:uncharacterized protein YcfJ